MEMRCIESISRLNFVFFSCVLVTFQCLKIGTFINSVELNAVFQNLRGKYSNFIRAIRPFGGISTSLLCFLSFSWKIFVALHDGAPDRETERIEWEISREKCPIECDSATTWRLSEPDGARQWSDRRPFSGENSIEKNPKIAQTHGHPKFIMWMPMRFGYF